MELKGKKINFIGDSITEGARVASPENFYPNLIKKNALPFYEGVVAFYKN